LFRDAQIHPHGNDATSALQRARAKEFVEVFLAKVNPHYYAAVVRGEVNVGPALIDSINTFLVPFLPEKTTFVIGQKFGLAEILVSPFVIRLYLAAKLGLFGDGLEAKLAEIPKWDRWAKAVLQNESLRKTFDFEAEARKTLDRVRKVREANKLTANGATNGAKV
jgi:glutathione S-transferase